MALKVTRLVQKQKMRLLPPQRYTACLLLVAVLLLTPAVEAQPQPMLHPTVSSNYAWLPHNVDPENNPTPDEFKGMPIQPLGDMQKRHNDYIQGCVDYYDKVGKGGHRCLTNEKERIEMSLRQIQSMRNYTEFGYTKIRAPEKVYQLLKDFWDKNRDKEKSEKWGAGNVYVYVCCCLSSI
jgi:prolyl 4-hydroxylase